MTTPTTPPPTPPPAAPTSPAAAGAVLDELPPPAGGGMAVTIRGLLKQYGTLRAVDNLHLDVPRGGIFGLIGPNGAGKTTTMLTIVTLLVPDAGLVNVLGADPVADPRAVRPTVGYMPDFFGLYDGLTCREYLDFFASTYGLAGAERDAQVNDLLELVELSHKADTDTSGLSRGLQQRLSLARALVHDPELLVLDEPASGLDPRARVELREIMLELSRLGHTILVSSHILAELEEICDRVGIIEAGQVLAQGTSDEIRSTVASVHAVTLRILGGAEARTRAVELATGAGAVHTPTPGGTLRFEVAGGSEAAADVLATLVAGGVRVVDFRDEAGGLERLFLTVTQGVQR